jgi:ATP-binding cassette subfamily F protein 3
MIAINLDRVSVTYIAKAIFTDLSWEIHDNRRVGLVGPNGCGKSTLLQLIGGLIPTDSGYLARQPGVTIGYLAQEPELTPQLTVWQEALTASTVLAGVEAELTALEARLADPTVYGDEDTLARVLDQQARLLERYEELGGPSYVGRVRAILKQLGFASESELNLPVESLSGGQKKLVVLAKLLILQPKVLLLDEPDNHLDLEGKAFLEQLIRDYEGAVIIVSHDRYLLDLVVEEIAELEDGRLTLYPGDYSEYAFEKRTRQLRQQQLYQTQQKEIGRLEQAAKRLITWGRVYDNEKLIVRGRSILKRLERMDRIEKPTLERRRMDLQLGGWRGSSKVLEISGIKKSYPIMEGGSFPVLKNLNLLIWHGERVGLIGANGTGKSLLLRLLLGQETADEGKIAIGPSVEIGYYAQEHETLNYQRTLIETVRDAAPYTESAAVSFLGKFLFSYMQAQGPVSELSGGERSRLQMALLMLSRTNFLLLDEPTNNLDIASAEVLEDAIANFEGTALIISHDRYFLDRVVDRIVELRDGHLYEYTGNYSDYLAAKG